MNRPTQRHSSPGAEGRANLSDHGVTGIGDVDASGFYGRSVLATRDRQPIHLTDGTRCPSCDALVDVLTAECRCS